MHQEIIGVSIERCGQGAFAGDYAVIETNTGRYLYMYEIDGFNMSEDEYIETAKNDFRMWLHGDFTDDAEVFEEL